MGNGDRVAGRRSGRHDRGLYGFATFADARRDGNLLAAVAAGTLAIAASLAFAAAIVFGLIVMVSG